MISATMASTRAGIPRADGSVFSHSVIAGYCTT